MAVTKKDPAAVALGRKGGKIGGPARAAKLTPEQRSEIARRAVQSRWAKAKKGGSHKLRQRENHIHSRNTNGLGLALRKQASPRQGKLSPGKAFSGFKAAGERGVSEQHRWRTAGYQP